MQILTQHDAAASEAAFPLETELCGLLFAEQAAWW